MIPNWMACANEVVGTFHRDRVPAQWADWPSWLPDQVVEKLTQAAIPRPYTHQVAFAELAFAGNHSVITTPTASGKTLAYLLPLLAASHGVVGTRTDSVRTLLSRPGHTALYLAPTKALAHDQYRTVDELKDPHWMVTTLDGDSEPAVRRFARDRADFILTNPDMLHHAVLPAHNRWIRFLSKLRYVVVDEVHRYHGTFGAHVSVVLRRLRRLCALHGSSPTFLLASATVPDAATFGGELIGEDQVAVVEHSGSPQPGLDLVLWQPEDSAVADTSRLLARLVDEGRQTISFVASRNLAELIAVQAAKESTSGARIGSYRGGYLARDRREIESELDSGELLGVSSTSALELGVDISGMDAVVVSGFPGKVSALWQQIGRAGRAGRDGLGVLVARDDPLDAYLFAHPDLLLSGSLEKQVLHPSNPYVLGPHLAAAAQEAPLKEEDTRWFGADLPRLADHLCSQKLLRRRPGGWYWTRPDQAAGFIDLRSASTRPVEVIEADTGRVLGSVDLGSADRALHEGAVHLHQGEQYLVVSYQPQEYQAFVVARRSGYYTQPVETTSIEILRCLEQSILGRANLCRGEVTLTSQVIGYLRRDEQTHKVWDQTPLDLDTRVLSTQAVWWSIPDQVLDEMGLSATRVGSAVHAMEHCAIGLLPAFAPCDRWDIGGVSTAVHPQTEQATVFIHDGVPGGAGFAHRGFAVADRWLLATAQRLTSCGCDKGCPACVVSPKCGNGNQFLDRFAARDLASAILQF